MTRLPTSVPGPLASMLLMIVAFSACEEDTVEEFPSSSSAPASIEETDEGAFERLEPEAMKDVMVAVDGAWSYGDPERDQIRFDTLGALTRVDDLKLTTWRYVPMEARGSVALLSLEHPPSGAAVGWALVRVKGDSLRVGFSRNPIEDWDEAATVVDAARWSPSSPGARH